MQTIVTKRLAESSAETTELVRRSQQGEADAFERLYRGHVGQVYALCLRMCGDTQRANELTQDVFVRAWSRLNSFRGESAFGTWLHRLAVNVIRDNQRSEGRRSARIDDKADPDLHTAPRGLPTEDDIELEKAVAALPPRAREVLILHEIHGYRCREIAEMLGTAVGTIQAHLHRSRKLLKGMLTP